MVVGTVHLLREDGGCYLEEQEKTGSKNSMKKTRRTTGKDTVTQNYNDTSRMYKKMNGAVGFVFSYRYILEN